MSLSRAAIGFISYTIKRADAYDTLYISDIVLLLKKVHVRGIQLRGKLLKSTRDFELIANPDELKSVFLFSHSLNSELNLPKRH